MLLLAVVVHACCVPNVLLHPATCITAEAKQANLAVHVHALCAELLLLLLSSIALAYACEEPSLCVHIPIRGVARRTDASAAERVPGGGTASHFQRLCPSFLSNPFCWRPGCFTGYGAVQATFATAPLPMFSARCDVPFAQIGPMGLVALPGDVEAYIDVPAQPLPVCQRLHQLTGGSRTTAKKTLENREIYEVIAKLKQSQEDVSTLASLRWALHNHNDVRNRYVLLPPLFPRVHLWMLNLIVNMLIHVAGCDCHC